MRTARPAPSSIHLRGRWSYPGLSTSSPSRLTTSCSWRRARATSRWTSGIRSTTPHGPFAASHHRTRSTWFWTTISSLVRTCDVLYDRQQKPKSRLISTGNESPSGAFPSPPGLGRQAEHPRLMAATRLLRYSIGLISFKPGQLHRASSTHRTTKEGNLPVFTGDSRKLVVG